VVELVDVHKHCLTCDIAGACQAIKRLDRHTGEDTPVATNVVKVAERVGAGEVADRPRGRNAAPAAAAGAMSGSGAEARNRREQYCDHRSETDDGEGNQHELPMTSQTEPASRHVRCFLPAAPDDT